MTHRGPFRNELETEHVPAAECQATEITHLTQRGPFRNKFKIEHFEREPAAGAAEPGVRT
jgi:hypothetical protein